MLCKSKPVIWQIFNQDLIIQHGDSAHLKKLKMEINFMDKLRDERRLQKKIKKKNNPNLV